MKNFKFKKRTQETKRGFTIIEVMLVLAITGLMLVGVLGGTYRNIEQQRYTDSYRSFAEYLRQNYNEVLSPESWSTDSGDIAAGRSPNKAIYGKIIVFGLNNDPEHVYSATVVGGTKIDGEPNSDFMTDLKAGIEKLGTESPIECETVADYTTRYGARLMAPANSPTATPGEFTGTLLIARSPSSGTVHTRFIDKTYSIQSEAECNSSGAGTFGNEVKTSPDNFQSKDVNICVKSDVSSVVRGIRIDANARNSSGVNMLTEEDSLKLGDNGSGGQWQCR